MSPQFNIFEDPLPTRQTTMLLALALTFRYTAGSTALRLNTISLRITAITTLAAELQASVHFLRMVAPTKFAPTPVTTSRPSRELARSRNFSQFDKASVPLEQSRRATISISGPSTALATHITSRSLQWKLSAAQEVLP